MRIPRRKNRLVPQLVKPKILARAWPQTSASPGRMQRRTPLERSTGPLDRASWSHPLRRDQFGHTLERLALRRVCDLSSSFNITPSSSQSPVPGFGDNQLPLSGLPSQSLASGGGSRLMVMFGQTRAYFALISSHFSRPGSVSGLIASTGHSGSQTPQSMHSRDE